MTEHSTRLIAGCMTGTSLDAVDAALVRIEGRGLGMRVSLVRTASAPLGSLGKLLRPAVEQKRLSAEKFTILGHLLGRKHVVVLKDLIGSDTLDLISVHGQTVFHRPAFSWQLIDPMVIAHGLGVPVVYDLRGADLASGGRGAPITPLADHVLFRHETETRLILNLGGFINATWLPPTKHEGDAALQSIRGSDICACNQLLDAIARDQFKTPFDEGGRLALEGRVDPEAEQMLLELLQAQAEDNRSLGTGDEARDWIRMFDGECDGRDLARTACAAIARVVAQNAGEADRIIVFGGGMKNQALIEELRSRLGEIEPGDAFGVPGQHREALAMGILGALSQDRVPITLPQVTGVRKAPVAGAWIYP